MPFCIVNLLQKSSQLHRCTCMVIIRRTLTSNEVSTALRPFYFNVHPDLFGQFPNERAVNETSLKTLSSVLGLLVNNRPPPPPTTLVFYLKSKSKTPNKASLKQVRIRLAHRNAREVVTSILTTCNLSTSYVDNIVDKPEPKPSEQYAYNRQEQYYGNTRRHEYPNEYNASGNDNPDLGRMKREVRDYKDGESLEKWLTKNYREAREKLEKTKPVRAEVEKLRLELIRELGLIGIKWDCGWDISHFKGCLVSFQTLCEHHRRDMELLKGRNVVFGNNTGVVLDGTIVLNSGEVRHNWLDYIKNFWKDDQVLRTVPACERAVSRVLRDIEIARRRFQPKTMAKDYENNLRRLTTSLSDYQGRYGYPKSWPLTLSSYKLVVESEAGPLMVSPTGQFIVPASCPPSLLVSFITENLEEANNLLSLYETNKHIERDLLGQLMSALSLVSLQKDDSVHPALMIQSCTNLLKHQGQLKPLLEKSCIRVTTFYSVMSDGEICIPWNWKL
uniref:T-cell activation inhibitor, mitochondrial n=1 Tax=Cacopsylla melanoneura TaxID=428564 RepID=A0A8D8PWF6_9HEMI